MRGSRGVRVALLVGLFAGGVQADRKSESWVELEVRPGAVVLRILVSLHELLAIELVDRDQDGQVTSGEVEAARRSFLDYTRRTLGLATEPALGEDARPEGYRVEGRLPVPLAQAKKIQVHMEWVHLVTGPVQRLQLVPRFLEGGHAPHRIHLRIRWDPLEKVQILDSGDEFRMEVPAGATGGTPVWLARLRGVGEGAFWFLGHGVSWLLLLLVLSPRDRGCTRSGRQLAAFLASVMCGLVVARLFLVPGVVVEPLVSLALAYLALENLCAVVPGRWVGVVLVGLVDGLAVDSSLGWPGRAGVCLALLVVGLIFTRGAFERLFCGGTSWKRRLAGLVSAVAFCVGVVGWVIRMPGL